MDLEPLSLEEREREPGMPVGLKNIGNTCYFNSFVQMLFYLPGFVEPILKIKEDESEQYQRKSLVSQRRIEASCNLVIEMKSLFAAMTKSNQKYVDPSTVIQNLVDDLGNQVKIGDEEDIGEVSERFMTWVDEGINEIVDEEDSDIPFAPVEKSPTMS